MSNFPKMPIFLSITFFVFSCLALLFFYREIDANNKELQVAEGQWQAEAFRRDEIKALDSSVKIIEAERAQLETHFAKSSDIVPFLDAIEGLAGKTAIEAEVVSVDILEDHTGLLVGMRASGTFAGIYRFLTLLENSPYELEFVLMDLQRQSELGVGGVSNNLKWDAVLKIKLLSFIE